MADSSHRNPKCSAHRRRGLSMVELMVALSLLVVGMLTVTSSVTRARAARQEADQESAAIQALEQAGAALRSLGVTAAWQTYMPNSQGEPFPAAGSGPGAAIAAAGLANGDDPSLPAQVTIRFFTNETASVDTFGLPRDLDGDALATNVNTGTIGGDGQLVATILPYELALRFRRATGGVHEITWHGVLTRAR